MSNQPPFKKTTDKEKHIIKIAKKIDDASTSVSKSQPILQRSEIQDVSRYLKESLNLIDVLTDKFSNASTNFNKALNRGTVRKKFQEPLNPKGPNTYSSRQSSTGSTSNNLRKPSSSAAHSPLSSSSTILKKSRELKQTCFTPNPYASANTRRRSSQFPQIDEPVSDDSRPRPVRKNLRQTATPKTSTVSKTTRRTSEASRLPSPSNESASFTPTRDTLSVPRPSNNRLSVIKDTTLESPGSSAVSPISSSATETKPDEEILIKTLNQQLACNYSSSRFQDHRPRDVVNQDYSKGKGTFSVAAATFQTYVEAYLRPLNLGDLRILEPQILDSSTQLIPQPKVDPQKPWFTETKEKPVAPPRKKPRASKKFNSSKNEFFENRILSLLLDTADFISDNLTDDSKSKDFLVIGEISPEESHQKVLASINKRKNSDSRALTELARLDILPFNAAPQSPYDEIMLELKRKQIQYKALNQYNNSMRERLTKISTHHLAFQDFNRYIDNLDSKLEQAYVKRQNAIKSRRKKPPSFSRNVPEGMPAIVEKRSRVISTISTAFDAENLQLPLTSVYSDIRCPPILIPDIFPTTNNKPS